MARLGKKKLAELLANLGHKRAEFCRQFVVEFKPKQAAEAAGYAKGATAATQAQRLMQNENVQTYIMHLTALKQIKTGVTAEKVVRELALIGFQDMADFVEYDWLDDGIMKVKRIDELGKHSRLVKKLKIENKIRQGQVLGQTIELELYDKLGALDKLGKHTAIFTENMNLNLTADGKPVAEALRPEVHVHIGHRAKGEDLPPEEEA